MPRHLSELGVGDFAGVCKHGETGREVCRYLCEYFKQLSTIEQNYAKALHQLNQSPVARFQAPMIMNFFVETVQEEFESIQKSWEAIKATVETTADCHMKVSEALETEICDVLTEFVVGNSIKTAAANGKGLIGELRSQHTTLSKDREKYNKAAQDAARAEKAFRLSTAADKKTKLQETWWMAEKEEAKLKAAYRTTSEQVAAYQIEFEQTTLPTIYNEIQKVEEERHEVLKNSFTRFVTIEGGLFPVIREAHYRAMAVIDEIAIDRDLATYIDAVKTEQDEMPLPEFEEYGADGEDGRPSKAKGKRKRRKKAKDKDKAAASPEVSGDDSGGGAGDSSKRRAEQRQRGRDSDSEDCSDGGGGGGGGGVARRGKDDVQREFWDEPGTASTAADGDDSSSADKADVRPTRPTATSARRHTVSAGAGDGSDRRVRSGAGGASAGGGAGGGGGDSEPAAGVRTVRSGTVSGVKTRVSSGSGSTAAPVSGQQRRVSFATAANTSGSGAGRQVSFDEPTRDRSGPSQSLSPASEPPSRDVGSSRRSPSPQPTLPPIDPGHGAGGAARPAVSSNLPPVAVDPPAPSPAPAASSTTATSASGSSDPAAASAEAESTERPKRGRKSRKNREKAGSRDVDIMAGLDAAASFSTPGGRSLGDKRKRGSKKTDTDAGGGGDEGAETGGGGGGQASGSSAAAAAGGGGDVMAIFGADGTGGGGGATSGKRSSTRAKKGKTKAKAAEVDPDEELISTLTQPSGGAAAAADDGDDGGLGVGGGGGSSEEERLLYELLQVAMANDYYALYELDSSASSDDIAKRRRELIQYNHPDRFGSDRRAQREATSRLQKINEVYSNVFQSTKNRALYDKLCTYRRSYRRLMDGSKSSDKLRLAVKNLASLRKDVKKANLPHEIQKEIQLAIECIELAAGS